MRCNEFGDTLHSDIKECSTRHTTCMTVRGKYFFLKLVNPSNHICFTSCVCVYFCVRVKWTELITVTAPDTDGYCSSVSDVVRSVFESTANMTVASSIVYTEATTTVTDRVFEQIEHTGRSTY